MRLNLTNIFSLIDQKPLEQYILLATYFVWLLKPFKRVLDFFYKGFFSNSCYLLMSPVTCLVSHVTCEVSDFRCHPSHVACSKRHCHLLATLFIYKARESSLVPAGFLTAQFLQKMQFMKPTTPIKTKDSAKNGLSETLL